MTRGKPTAEEYLSNLDAILASLTIPKRRAAIIEGEIARMARLDRDLEDWALSGAYYERPTPFGAMELEKIRLGLFARLRSLSQPA